MVDKPEFFDSLDDAPDACKICGASDFRFDREEEKEKIEYKVFICPLCRHEIWIKK